MFFRIYTFITLITAVGSFIIGFFVLILAFKSRTSLHKIWFWLCSAIFGWSFGFYITLLDRLPKNFAIIASRFHHASGILIVPLFLHFILIFLNSVDKKRKQLIVAYTTSALLAILCFTPFVVPDLTSKLIFKYWPEGKIGYVLYVINFIVWAIYGHLIIIRNYKGLSDYKRNQLKYFLIGTILGFSGGSSMFFLVFNIKVFNIQIPPYGSTLIIVYLFTTTYAILKHRLMDIKIAITRTGIFVAVYTLVLGFPFAVAGWAKGWLIEYLGPGWWMGPLVLMALLATVGPFIYIYIERRAEERLLREQRRYQATLKHASVGMTRIRNLTKLLNLITHIVTKTVRISYVAIYLYDREADEYILQVCRDKGRIPVSKLSSSNPLISWITSRRQPLLYEEIKRKLEDTREHSYRELEENMLLLNASVVIPSFLEDKSMGFIVFGDKTSGQIYTSDDLDVFQVLASQAALAIENAQFYEETRQMQEQISQAEKMATIGTMADGLSHQINNRFHALSLIAGDTIDTIKMTNTSTCSPEVKEMLSQINYALGRIQANVMQGGEVVKGILKYTRKGEEGFGPLCLDEILDSTLEMVRYKVKLSEFDIIRDYPANTPRVLGNLVQLQEAFFNFIDNAYDAIVERRQTLQESNYRGKITVTAIPKNNHLEITIQDNGMGVKGEDYKKVFTPFFTTKATTNKGTGLGLYVVRKIITDTHKGRISFESTYGVGTRFIIELPLVK